MDEDNQMLGVVETKEALQRARDAGLDLVEVAPDSRPPVCRILDYGKYKYEQSKKKDKSQKKTGMDLKEVRLGRSMKIDPHDIEIRLKQARKFLLEGHKVQIVQNFRGREMAHQNRGRERMQDIIEKMSDIARVESPPKMAGRRITMILAPDKAKVESYKKRHKQSEGGESTAKPSGESEPSQQPPSSSASEQAGEQGSSGDEQRENRASDHPSDDRSTSPEPEHAEQPRR